MPTHNAALAGDTNAWHLSGTVGSTTLDVYVTVPNDYQWGEHVDASKFQEPCTGAITIMVSSDGTVGKLFGKPAMFCYGSAAKDAVADLRTAWRLGGPWTLATPTASMTVYGDPTQGDFSEQNTGDHWAVSAGWQEA